VIRKLTKRPAQPPAAEVLATWTPVQVDEVIAQINGDIGEIDSRRDSAQSRINNKLSQVAKGRTLLSYEQSRLEEDQETVARLAEKLEPLYAELRPYDDEYTRRRWTRYWIVDNTNGHVHNTRHCQTCYPTTQYRWLTELSGSDDAACIELVGETACTVCMPDAPKFKGFGDGQSGWAKNTAEEIAEKERMKAEKAAKQAEKAITDVDGSPLRHDHSTIRTLVSAKQALNNAVENALIYPNSEDRYTEQRNHLAAAIAHKTGETIENVIAAAEKSVAARRRRQERQYPHLAALAAPQQDQT
jgi:hypothetical protein